MMADAIQMEDINDNNNLIKNETGRITEGDYITDGPDRTTRKAIAEIIPIHDSQNIPLALSGQCTGSSYIIRERQRRYTKAKFIETLAVRNCKQNGRGIGFKDLLSNAFALHKQQAQTTLKHCLRANILFTIGDRKPQEYYPTCLKSEILSKNIPIGPTRVGFLKPTLLRDKDLKKKDVIDYCQTLDPTIVQTLEEYVLPLLPQTPFHIHKMQFKVRIPRECYQEIALPVAPWNKGKEHEEIIGGTHARYRFYANGTVVVSTESGNNPFKIRE